MTKRYLIDRTDEERTALRTLLQKGPVSARKKARARLLRLASEGRTDAQIAEA